LHVYKCDEIVSSYTGLLSSLIMPRRRTELEHWMMKQTGTFTTLKNLKWLYLYVRCSWHIDRHL